MDPQVLREAMTAYQAVYDEDLRETIEFENWVNSLLEEGYDLSDYTWEDMYESYLSEMGTPGGNRPGGNRPAKPAVSNLGPNYKQQERDAAANAQRFANFKAGGGNAAVRPQDRINRRGGGSTIKPEAQRRIEAQGVANISSQSLRDRNRPAQNQPPTPRPGTPATSAAPRPTATAAPRPGTTATPRPGTTPGSPKPGPTTTSTPSATPKPRPKDTSITDMIGRSQVRQGAPINTGNKSSDIRAMAARGSVGATPTTSVAKPAPAARPMGSRKPGSIVSGFDLFDVVKGHLLDEGYADTEEAALAIMANMSEEWRDSIVEGLTPLGVKTAGVVDDQRRGSTRDKDLKGTRDSLDKLKAYPKGFPGV
jgi:hypothetical protein